MPIQIIPKPEERKPLLPGILFYFSVFLLFLAIAGFFILNNLIRKTQQTIASIDQETADLKVSPEGLLEVKLLDYQNKINDFSNLINDYRYSSQVFPFIESLVHPQVSFSDFNLDNTKGIVTVSGVADSFKTLAQQQIIFKKEPRIKEIKLSDVSLGKGKGIPFTFELTLDLGVFAKKPAESKNSNE